MSTDPSNPADAGAERDRELVSDAWRQAEHAARQAAAQAATVETPSGPAAPPALSLPGYEILKEVHRGGQGVVYQAIQKSTKRKVAVKVMKEGPFAGSSDRARFEREVQILGQLKHPNIVTIHDSGTAAGWHFFVMDYIQGASLDEWMREQQAGAESTLMASGRGPSAKSSRAAIDDSLRVFVKICDAVSAAHLRGVIHRDLKPGNIRMGADGEPHVLDFGLAKGLVGQDGTGAMTVTGQFLGSLPWASPEQAEGASDRIDLRTDVYSLGVMLYQMLTGRFPYDVVGNMRDVLDRIMKAEPAKPSTLDTRDSPKANTAVGRWLQRSRSRVKGRQINDEIETIVLKCLQKDRERRYQTAGELARDIRHYLAGEPIEAKRDSVGYVLRKQLRRYRGPVIAVAAVFLALVAGLTTTTLLYFTAQNAEARAKANFQKARNAVDRLLTGENRLVEAPQMEEERQRLLQDALEVYRELLKDESADPLVRQETGRAYQRTAMISQMLGNYESAEADATQALTIHQALADEFPHQSAHILDAAQSLQALGDLFRGTGRTIEAEISYRKAMVLLDPLHVAQPGTLEVDCAYAAVLNGLGITYRETERPSEAALALQEALELRAELVRRRPDVAEYPLALADSYDNWGQLQVFEGHRDRAKVAYGKALQIRTEVANDHPGVTDYARARARSCYRMANLHDTEGELHEARPIYQEALQIYEKVARDHPTVLEYQNDLATVLRQLGKVCFLVGEVDEAEQAFKRALELFDLLTADRPRELQFSIDLGLACVELSRIYRERGELEEALPLYSRGIQALDQVIERAPDRTLARKELCTALMDRAETLVRLRRESEAREDWSRMVELAEAQTNVDVRNCCAMALGHLGDHKRATAEVEFMLAQGQEPENPQYNFACVYSLSSAAALSDKSISPTERSEAAERYAARAVHFLLEARAKGVFQSHGYIDYMKKDQDLRPLASRNDFQQLWAELEAGRQGASAPPEPTP